MPHEEMNEQQTAAYLHMDQRQLVKFANRGQVPCRKVRGEFRFRKGEIDHWVETRMPELGREQLARIEKGVSDHHGFDEMAPLVVPMMPDKGIAVPLNARTGDSVLRALVDLADGAGMVYAKAELLDEIRNREQLCSTALAPNVAVPHPRHPVPYDIAESFVVVGLTPNGIPFGAPDGTTTRLFFLICCKDDRTHLHVLARLAQMLHDDAHIAALLKADAADELRTILDDLETTAIGLKQ